MLDITELPAMEHLRVILAHSECAEIPFYQLSSQQQHVRPGGGPFVSSLRVSFSSLHIGLD